MNMIEKVARAINPRAFKREEHLFESWQKEAEAKALRQARAAIEAMREPTNEMLEAISAEREVTVPAGTVKQRVSGRQQWLDAIDAALKESEPNPRAHNYAPFSDPGLNTLYRVDEAGVIWDRVTGENISECLEELDRRKKEGEEIGK